ncbi:hypothetical protein L1987_14063 [Smallanthus sonchifolius]|uniref:Uncharacterized protein n=1 Tax=Smallanthus sonchifolius TaxID=185202 RepID=A0ACB9J3A6_9ASTR|nr:hypothetical protein L1987_14063 [Smallanthus sonchifolius]
MQNPSMQGNLIVVAGSEIPLWGNENSRLNPAHIDPNREDESAGRDNNQIMEDSEITCNLNPPVISAGSPDLETGTDHAMGLREEGMNAVFINQEYSGASILANLSKEGLCLTREEDEEDGEMEVCSAQNTNQGHSDHSEKASTGTYSYSNSVNPDNNSLDTKDVTWERLNSQRVVLRWPDHWGESWCTELPSKGWEITMQAIKKSWDKEYGEGSSDLHQESIFSKSYQGGYSEVNFFEKYNSMVECLAKWDGQHKLNDHEAWRKVPGNQGFPNWLDVEREACNQEETMHRKKKKKRKNKGRNPFRGQKSAPSRGDGIMPPPLGFSEFRLGSDQKDEGKNQVSKAPTGSRMDGLYKDLRAKESRLKEIATNILKTDANRVLLHSILSMKSCKLRKFSAKVNDRGEVTIDEDMVDTGSGDLDNNIKHPGAPVASQMGQGTRYGNNLNNNLNGPRNIRTGAGTDNRNKKGNNAAVCMENRNIVINGQSTHSTKDTENVRDTDLNYWMRRETNWIKTVEKGRANLYDGKKMNSGWIKKQERTLNKEYSKMVTQDQRFEAKKYVLDQLVPLDSTLSEWPKPQIHYFRQLCSLYDFGPGYLAVNREKDIVPPVNVEMDDSGENQEDVESENDATAQMMNIDGPPVIATNASCMNNMGLDGPTQPGIQIPQAGVITQSN